MRKERKKDRERKKEKKFSTQTNIKCVGGGAKFPSHESF